MIHCSANIRMSFVRKQSHFSVTGFSKWNTLLLTKSLLPVIYFSSSYQKIFMLCRRIIQDTIYLIKKKKKKKQAVLEVTARALSGPEAFSDKYFEGLGRGEGASIRSCKGALVSEY